MFPSPRSPFLHRSPVLKDLVSHTCRLCIQTACCAALPGCVSAAVFNKAVFVPKRMDLEVRNSGVR